MKLSPGHEGLIVHQSSPQKRAERVENLARYHKIGAACYDFRGNHLLGMGVRKDTEIDLKNMLRWSKKPPGTMKLALHTMIFEEIIS